MKCFCCGEEGDSSRLVALRCRDDVNVCGTCIGWLRERTGRLDVTPILPVLDMDASVRFYETAGFDVRVYPGGGYAFVAYEDGSMFDLGLEEQAAGGGCYVIVADVDEWHTKFTALGHPVTEVKDEDFGMREFTLTDPTGNRLRFGHSAEPFAAGWRSSGRVRRRLRLPGFDLTSTRAGSFGPQVSPPE